MLSGYHLCMSDLDNTDPSQPTVTLLLSGSAALRSTEFAAALRASLGAVALDGVIPGLPVEDGDGGLACTVAWGDHKVRCIQVLAPAPGLDEMIQTSRIDKAQLRPLTAQAGHVLCYYCGTAAHPADRILALFRLAAACRNLGVIGIIHTDAWQCIHADALTHFADPAHQADLREALAHKVLCNLIPFHGDGGSWWTSKGNHVFGIPDLALWDDGAIGSERAYAIHAALFAFLRGGAVMKPGETMEHEGLVLDIGPVTEHVDFLAGRGETLALRPAGGGRPGSRRGLMILAGAAVFFGALVFYVPPYYTGMKITLGVLAGLAGVLALLAFIGRRR